MGSPRGQAAAPHPHRDRPREDDLRHVLGGFAHDVRSIASAAEGLAFRIAARVGDDARTATHLEAIRESMQRLVAISTGVIELAKHTTRPDLPGEPVALGRLCEVVAATLVEESASRAVSLHVELAGDPRVRGDRGELYRMILNLVQNAIVHGSPSGGRVRIALREGAPRGVELVVDDDGRGFPASMLGGGARSPEWRDGHGLGLAIAWAIAHRHGAQLVIENRGEGGGRARVSFEEVSR